MENETVSVHKLHELRQEYDSKILRPPEVPGSRIDLTAVMARDQIDHEIVMRHRKKGLDWAVGDPIHPKVE